MAGSTSDDIAVVGMAGRFPGAPDLKAFWRNLRDGVESVRRLAPTELEDSPYTPRLREHPDFVAAAGILDGADLFDHGLFGMSRRESRIIDPQQRVFLELAWAALEDAGIDPFSGGGRISVYAGASSSGHLLSLLAELGGDPASVYEAMTGATSENLATRVAFALRLRGEAVTLHTACSTGLSVVHAACQSLLLGQSRVALAGSVRIAVPQRTGYAYQEGMILSRDGHCRAFDAESSGTVPGNGAGVVVLKPADAALADGDRIYALVRATAINNDGHRGVGYTAPSVGGQAEVITEAMAFAGVGGDDIGYVEAHGTGTPLGDPIEVAALTRAYRESTQRVGDCPIGSVKSNIGHLDTAAGIAGFIKVALMLHHGEIPPTLHVREPNPNAGFGASPFFPVTELRRWPEGRPRLAAVSSFGIGGTNVHAILEQAPQPVASAPSPREHHLVTLSAQTPQALDDLTAQLADALDSRTVPVEDVAWTRAVGRAGLPHRRTVVATGVAELVNSLRRRPRATKAMADPRVVFLFPGQGSASHGMAGQLYRAEPVFREELENVLTHLDPHTDTPLLPVLLDGDGPLLDPVPAHAGLFAVEYALARLWQRWGIRPHAVVGHSFGEYAAACVAGVLPLPDAARLAVLRGRLVTRMPEGGMLAVAAEETHLLSYLDGELSLAAVNGDGRCVVSGPPAALATLGQRLEHAGFAHVPLGVAKAFHSASVDPVLGDLRAAFEGCPPGVPQTGLVSSLTGRWWSETDGTPDYWARQMREPVRFADALETLTRDGEDLVFLEAGPDQALTALTRAQLGRGVPVAASLRRQGSAGPDQRVLFDAAGTLWRAGVRLDWTALYAGEQRRRVSLPAYPFEHTEVQAPHAEVTTTDRIERQVLLVWQERLGADDFGVHDNFLELGGNSLMAAQVLTRLRETFGVDLPLSALFDAPTVAGVAEQIRRLSGSDTTSREPAAALPHPQKLPPPANPPLSVAQQRTLALEAADPGNTALLMPIAVRIDGPLDPEALRAALGRLAARHDTLRTTFHLDAETWTARLGDHPPTLGYDQLPPGADPDAEACAIAALDAARPVDLVVCPFRLRLLRFGPDRHLLLLTMHHVIADTWSMLVFLRELAALHDGQELPAPGLQYADFTAWQRRNLSGGALAGQQAYWREVLADAPAALPLPTDNSRAMESGARGYRIPVEFSPELSQRLTDVCHRGGFTPFAAVLAGYAGLLARITGCDDIVVGTPIGNRERPELQGLIGYVAHCLPLRTRLGDDPAFWELADRVQHAVADAYRHPDLPYEHLAGKTTGRLFSDAAFVMHTGIDERLTSGATTWTLWPVSGLPAQFGATLSPLTLMLTEHDGRFDGVLEYAAELFTEESARRLVRQLAALLDAATREPHLPLSQWEIEMAVAR